jgi:NDP-sugar pyrophosphorylase family protein
VVGIREKPVVTFLVNAGIYLLEPSAQRLIPHDRPFDMTDLIARMIKEGRPMVSYPVVEYWLDVGSQADYQRAQDDVRDGRFVR